MMYASRSLLILPLMVMLAACSMPPDHDHVFKKVPLYTQSIDLTMQMLANEAIYERLEKSLPNIKRAHGLEQEHCLILTGWTPMEPGLRHETTAQRIHRLEQFDWHLHKKNPDKKIITRICTDQPCSLLFSLHYSCADGEYIDMGMDIFTAENTLFSVKIHGAASVMMKERKRFEHDLEQIRQALGNEADKLQPRT